MWILNNVHSQKLKQRLGMVVARARDGGNEEMLVQGDELLVIM